MNQSELRESNHAVTARYLGMLEEMAVDTVRDRIQPDQEAESFCYYRITELQKHWLKEETPLWELMSGLFVGLSAVRAEISIVFYFDGKKLGVYVGTKSKYADVLEGMLRGVFPHICLEENSAGNSAAVRLWKTLPYGFRTHGGFLKGNPAGSENMFSPRQIDGVIKGMQGCPWHYSIFASPVERRETIARQQYWMSEASRWSMFSDLTVSESDGRETLTFARQSASSNG